MSPINLNNMKNVLLTSEQLIMLLNELYIESKISFSILDGIVGQNLMKIKIADDIQIDLVDSIRGYNQKYKKLDPDLANEYPNKERYFEIFLKSGFFFKQYYRQYFIDIINEMEQSNPLEGDLPIAIAFDTNMYFNQVFSQLCDLLRNKYGNPKYPVNFLLSEGVQKELIGYERKLKKKDLDVLKVKSQYPNIIDKFFNQNKLQSRLWHLGHCDFLKCINYAYTKIIDEGDSVDKTDMDSRIIKGLVDEIRQQNIKLYLFSFDSDFIARARGNINVVGKYLEKIPIDINEKQYKCKWEKFLRFLYYLAISFGAVILRFSDGTKIIIFGIWAGKKLHHWEEEAVKVYTDSQILNNIIKDLEILNKTKNIS